MGYLRWFRQKAETRLISCFPDSSVAKAATDSSGNRAELFTSAPNY